MARTRVAIALLLVSARAEGASIGLFASPDCSSCNLNLAGSSGVLYICASGPSSYPGPAGLIGAEFRVDGLPPGWTAQSTRAPASTLSIGDPFGNGTNIAFPSWQSGPCTLLFSVAVVTPQVGASATLQVERHNTPSNPFYSCPWLMYDDFEPVRVCVPGGALFVNLETPCMVGLQPAAWSRIKTLYQ
jgi:hypothetical protein